jgi:hypothetical protein
VDKIISNFEQGTAIFKVISLRLILVMKGDSTAAVSNSSFDIPCSTFGILFLPKDEINRAELLDGCDGFTGPQS